MAHDASMIERMSACAPSCKLLAGRLSGPAPRGSLATPRASATNACTRAGCKPLCAAALRRTAAVRMEHGPDIADEVVEGLVLMRERAQAQAQSHAHGAAPTSAPRAAVVWSCPVCEQRFTSSRDYLAHVELFHEELALQVRPGHAAFGCSTS